tara:strand:- start:371 stop:577 length:207 start_codon:yes stop_codon:yes gene_type:complete
VEKSQQHQQKIRMAFATTTKTKQTKKRGKRKKEKGWLVGDSFASSLFCLEFIQATTEQQASEKRVKSK